MAGGLRAGEPAVGRIRRGGHQEERDSGLRAAGENRRGGISGCRTGARGPGHGRRVRVGGGGIAGRRAGGGPNPTGAGIGKNAVPAFGERGRVGGAGPTDRRAPRRGAAGWIAVAGRESEAAGLRAGGPPEAESGAAGIRKNAVPAFGERGRVGGAKADGAASAEPRRGRPDHGRGARVGRCGRAGRRAARGPSPVWRASGKIAVRSSESAAESEARSRWISGRCTGAWPAGSRSRGESRRGGVGRRAVREGPNPAGPGSRGPRFRPSGSAGERRKATDQRAPSRGADSRITVDGRESKSVRRRIGGLNGRRGRNGVG